MKEGLNASELTEVYGLYRDLFIPALFTQMTFENHQEHLDRLKELGYIENGNLIMPTIIWSMLTTELKSPVSNI